MLSTVLLLVALIVFIIAAIINPTTVYARLIAVGLAFLAAGLGGATLLGG